MIPRTTLAAIAALALASAACDRAPSADGLKEWTPEDHDQPAGKGPAANQGAKGDAGGTPALVEVTWRQQCAACHGAAGKGDGPQGPMFKAPDLTREDWQAKATDEEIAQTITQGKGRMPKFELPDEVVRGLVSRVRSFRGR